MMEMNRHFGSSRRKVATSTMSAAFTVSVNSPKAIALSRISASTVAAIWVARSLSRSLMRLPFDRAGAADLLLEKKKAVHQRFGARRAAGHINIDGHDAVATAHHRIGIVIIAAAIGAGAHGDDVARFRHLVVDLAQRRSHFVAQGAGDDH